MSNEELAYLAGFVDGEGCITISKQHARHIYQVSVSAAQIDPSPLLILRNRFGGQVRVGQDSRGFRSIHYWKTQSSYAYEALQALLPYLVVKRTQAEVAIRLQERIYNFRSSTSESYEDEVREREALYLAMKALKKQLFPDASTQGPVGHTNRQPRRAVYRLSGGPGSGKPRPSRRIPTNPERLEEVRRLRREGLSFSAVARALGVSEASTKAYIRRWGMGE